MVKMNSAWKMQRRTIHDPQWDDDETVTIRSWFGDRDKQAVLSSSTEYIRDDVTGEMRIIATLDKLHATKRKLAVISWTLKDEENRPLPFNEDNLLNLPTYVAEFIDAEINKDWDNLGEPATSKEEAEAQEAQAKEDKATFQRSGNGSDAGAAINGRENDGERTGNTRRRSPEIART